MIALVGGIGVMLVLTGITWLLIADATPRRAPAQSQRHAANARHQARQASEPAGITYTTAFDTLMVQEQREWVYQGMKTLDVGVLNETKGADLTATARACAANYLPKYEYIQCWVYDSKERYDFLNQTASLPKGNYGLINQCYVVLARQKRGEKPTVADVEQTAFFTQQGCP